MTLQIVTVGAPEMQCIITDAYKEGYLKAQREWVAEKAAQKEELKFGEILRGCKELRQYLTYKEYWSGSLSTLSKVAPQLVDEDDKQGFGLIFRRGCIDHALQMVFASILYLKSKRFKMTRLEISKKFPKDIDVIRYFERMRWGAKPKCAYCGSKKLSKRTKDFRFMCYNCHKSSFVTVGTFLHGTNVDLRKWLMAFSVVGNSQKGISASQLKKDLSVSYPTAWKLYCKIRDIMSIENNGDGTIIAHIIKATTAIKLKRRIKIRDEELTRCVQIKSRSHPILHIEEAKASLRFSKVMNFLGKGVMSYYWPGISKNMLTSFWAMIERHIRVQHNPIELTYIRKYMYQAVFEITPTSDINRFEIIVKKSMQESKWIKQKELDSD